MDGEIRVTTIGELIDALTARAAELPEGLDTRVAAGTCDGERLQMAWTVGVDFWALMQASGDRQQFMLIRAHPHLDPEPMQPLHSGVEDITEQLRLWEQG